MKKIILIYLFLFSASITYAVNEKKEDIQQKCVAQICCVRTAVDKESGESVSVRACVTTTGDAVIDKGKACSRAKDMAVKALDILVNTID